MSRDFALGVTVGILVLLAALAVATVVIVAVDASRPVEQCPAVNADGTRCAKPRGHNSPHVAPFVDRAKVDR